MNRRLLLPFAAVAAMLVLLSGCAGPTFSSLPLPGSGISGPTITVEADFDEALNLANGAAVRVNGVDDGRVTAVTTRDFKAIVTMKIRTDARMHQGATARLRYTTPLGELFVDVANPATGPLMASGASLSDKQTSTAPTVEDALASASLLINGGGLAQLQTIVSESNKILDGNQGTIRDAITRLNVLLGQANGASGQINSVLTDLNGLAVVLRQRRATIHAALTDITPASKAIRANLGQITALLASLNRFAGTANGVVNRTHTQVLTLVDQAGPILQELSNVRGVLPSTLASIVAMASTADNLIPGDYLNLGAHLNIDVIKLLTGAVGPSSPGGSSGGSSGNNGGLGGIVGGLVGGLTGHQAAPSTKAPASNSLSGLLGGLL